MFMDKSLTFFLSGAVIMAVLAFTLGSGEGTFGAAATGTSATVATSSSQAVGDLAAELLFATTTADACLSRVISTQGGAIKLTFSDYRGEVPTITVGHVQGASTTVAYDASVYGCNAVRVMSFGAQSLQIAELR
jgi:hypothetical protein